MLKKIIKINKPIQTEVVITSKKIKSLILKYKDGQFYLSKPAFVSEIKAIEWLEGLSEEQFYHLMNRHKIKMTDEFVYVFGKKYSIKQYDMNEPKIVFRDNLIYVYKKDYLNEGLKQILKAYCEKKIEEFKIVDFKVKVDVQNMSSKWGCCFYKENRIKFSTKLIHEPKEIIDGIILHELVHFYYPNHQKEFYHLLKKYNPNYKLHDAFLKAGGVGDDPISK